MIEEGALLDALGLDQHVAAPGNTATCSRSSSWISLNGPLQGRPGRDVVAGRKDGGAGQAVDDPAAQRVDLADGIDLVSEKFNPQGAVLFIGGKDLHACRRAPGRSRGENRRRCVRTGYQPAACSRVVAIQFHPFLQAHQHAVVILRRTEAVNAGDTGDDRARRAG